jgi:hypothetical protein
LDVSANFFSLNLRCLKNRCHSSRTEGILLSRISAVGKVPGETEHILDHFAWKATDFKHGGTVEDGEKDLYERLGPCSDLSTPSQSTLWLHQDGLFSIKALEGEDMSSLVARRLTQNMQPFVAHRQSYAIVDSFGIFNTMGLTLSQRTRIFSFIRNFVPHFQYPYECRHHREFIFTVIIIVYDAHIILLNFFMVSTSM